MENKKPFILMFCGIMGTGKTTLATYFASKLGCTRFNTDDVRRLMGFKTFDRKDTPAVNEHMYSRARELLKKHESVIFDSAYKLREAREKIYQIARELKVPVIVIECFCSAETAIQRLQKRQKDDIHSPTNDPAVYREYAKMWESPTLDLEKSNEHVSLLKINTDDNVLSVEKISPMYKKELSPYIKILQEIYSGFN